MNFFDREKEIKQLLILDEKRERVDKAPADRHWKGCYVISRNDQDNVHKLGVAWGEGGLFNRLKNYKICMPYQDEYFVQYIFVCDTKEKSQELEKKILSRTDKFTDKRIAEQAFDDEKVSGARSKEYRFTAKKQDLKDLLTAELNDNMDLWRYAVIFGKNSWKIFPSTKKLTNLQRPASSRTEKPSFADMPKKDTFIPGVAVPVQFKKGKVVWGVSKTKGKLKAYQGTLDGRIVGEEWYVKWKGYKLAYAVEKKNLYASKDDAEADFGSY
jgi:hypothetical protein